LRRKPHHDELDEFERADLASVNLQIRGCDSARDSRGAT